MDRLWCGLLGDARIITKGDNENGIFRRYDSAGEKA